MDLTRDAPKTRGECVDGPRPCPYISCRYNLMVDVTRTGHLIPNIGNVRRQGKQRGSFRKLSVNVETTPDEIERFADALIEWYQDRPTCALDIADDGPITLEEIGGIFGMSRERVRQIESAATYKLHRLRDQLGELPE